MPSFFDRLRNLPSAMLSISAWRRFVQKYGTYCSILMLFALMFGFGWNQFGSGGCGKAPVGVTNPIAMKVNGISITQKQVAAAQSQALQQEESSAQATGEASVAQAYATAVGMLVTDTVVKQIAAKDSVTVAPSMIDTTINTERQQLGIKNDSDWQSYLSQRGITESQLRKSMASDPRMLVQALTDYYKSKTQVTLQDVNNQNVQVNLCEVFVPVGKFAFAPPTAPSLSDPQAKAKITGFYNKVKAGSSCRAIAGANPLQKGIIANNGVTGFQPEYPLSPSPLDPGTAFDNAVHATKVNDVTPVTPTTGILKGYAFAKVLGRKTVVPKGWNAAAAKQQLVSARANQQLEQDVQNATSTAKVEVMDVTLKPYYDMFQIAQVEHQMMQGGASNAPVPSAAQITAIQNQMAIDFAAALKAKPSDPVAAYMVAQDIQQNKLNAKGVTPQQRTAYLQQLVTLYNTVLNSTEDRDVRFALADTYRQQKDFANANSQYELIAKFMGQSPPNTPQLDQQYITYYQRLASAFSAIGKPDEAAEMQKQIAAIQKQIPADQARQAAIEKQQAAEQAAQQGGNQVSLPPGGSTTSTVVPPAPASKGKPASTKP